MPGLNWYLNRLRAMSPAEVGYRLRHSAQTRGDRLRLLTGRLPGAVLLPVGSGEGFDVPFFFDPARLEEMRAGWSRDYPDGLARLRAEADSLCAGRATIFDRELTWTDAPEWHADLLRGGEWPRRFWSEVPIRDGGVKYAWELARHQHLMTLARAAFLTGEPRFSSAACRWLVSWIDENPPYIGIHWTSALELGLRLIAWSWIFRLLRPLGEAPAGRPVPETRVMATEAGSEAGSLLLPPPVAGRLSAVASSGWTRELEREFFRAIQLQAEFVRRYHSDHSSANNHLIGEAAGVATAGLAFPWLAEADRWRDWGLAILARELPRQCHPDGVTAEQTFHYQAFVMDLVLQPVLLARHQGHELPGELLDRLEAMAGFLYTAMDASGTLPNVGDADDGAAILLGQDIHSPYRSLLATCGVLFNRPEFCRAAGAFDEKSAWLLGPMGRERFEKLSIAAEGISPPGSRQFPAAGYTVLRSGAGADEQLLLMDHGPLGYLSIAAHAHADCLSLVMHLGGHPALVDPGTYTYHEQPAWREYFRGTPAHNALIVDGKHQSVMTGPTMWGQRANATQRRWTTRPAFDFVEAEHDGYERLPGRPLHRRSVFHRRSGATFVVDRLLGSGEHTAELTWHLAPGARVSTEGDLAWSAAGDGFHLYLAILADGAAEAVIVEGDEVQSADCVSGNLPGASTATDDAIRNTQYSLPQGWVSPHFGERVPAPVLCSRRGGSLPTAWVTVLLPAPLGGLSGAAVPTVQGRVEAHGAVVELTQPGHRELYAHTFTDDRQGSVSPPWLELGDGRFRGEAAHLLLDEEGRPVEICVVGGLELEWDDRLVWRAPTGAEDAHVVLGPPEAADRKHRELTTARS
jgi:hypothetical protein